jgi:hypothetical protein
MRYPAPTPTSTTTRNHQGKRERSPLHGIIPGRFLSASVLTVIDHSFKRASGFGLHIDEN